MLLKQTPEKLARNYRVAYRVLLLFTVGWIIQACFIYSRLLLRPEGLYEPNIWITRFFFPVFPEVLTWMILFFTALTCTVFLFFKQPVLIRMLLTGCLLVLNVLEASYGNFEHTNHLFLLAHLFSWFVPFSQARTVEHTADQYHAVRWYHFGLLFTYGLAGLWKVVELGKILFGKDYGISWLDSPAIILNAVTGYRLTDKSFDVPHFIMENNLAVLSPGGFIVFTLILLMAPFAAFRRELQVIVIPGLCLFHLSNLIVSDTSFLTSTFILIILFFPYIQVNKKVRRFSAVLVGKNSEM